MPNCMKLSWERGKHLFNIFGKLEIFSEATSYIKMALNRVNF